MKVRTRIAPSPTGNPHVGTAYQALFNFVFARKQQGEFILRIEDTDQKRLVKGAEKEIVDALKWLGLEPDQGPIRQSDRLEIYQNYARKLLDLGAAYQDHGAIRQKIPRRGTTKFTDLIRGEISFDHKNLDESILLKSDGFPTYHLAVVVDDHLMEITHIIRGEEWIPSVPKHILIYQALNWKIPQFVHLPLIRDVKRAKLGKRFGDVSLQWFRNQGFLPAALLNYLAHLAWTHPEGKEIFSLSELIEKFKFEHLNKAAPIFDLEKLRWTNGLYIRTLSLDVLSSKFRTQNSKLKNVPDEDLQKIIPLVQNRMKTLVEFNELTTFFFEEPEITLADLLREGRGKIETAQVLATINSQLSTLETSSWKSEILEKICRDFVKGQPSLSTKDLFMTLRIVITGKAATPPLFETLEVIGKEKTLRRIKRAVSALRENLKA